MADDTGTDWAALAAELDKRAQKWESLWESVAHDSELDRAAAVGLRRLAQLDTAIGDPEELRGWVDEYNGIMLRNFAAHILAAVLGSGEQPEGPTTAVSDCPTCWSTDPAKRWNDAAEAVCPDSWHGGRR